MTRLVPPTWRLRLLGPMAVATSAVLLPTALVPGLWVTIGLWVGCGLLGAHDTVPSATFQRAVPDQSRGQVYGLASAARRAAQGLGIALAGALAELTTPATAIAVFAAAGVLAGVPVAIGWQRGQSRPTDSTGSDAFHGAVVTHHKVSPVNKHGLIYQRPDVDQPPYCFSLGCALDINEPANGYLRLWSYKDCQPDNFW